MYRRPILMLIAVTLPLGTATVLAEVKTSEVTFKSGDETIKAFRVVPEGKGPFPAVVMIQEWWGLNDWIKENAKRLAGKGYLVLAPDLYRGKVTADPKVAAQLLKGMPKDRALRDLKAAVDYLEGLPNVHKDKIGALGWCMGGGYSLTLGLNDPRIKAMAMCYGPVVTHPDKLQPLKAAVLGIFGEDDKGIPADDVRTFEASLKTAGIPVESVNVYADAGHGFMRPMNGAEKNPAYREVQANDAWQRIDTFFAKVLGAGKDTAK